jgi:hypothetical protein
MKPRVLIDFDGPIHKYSKGFGNGEIYDEPTEGAKEFIDSIKEDYEIVIFTARGSSGDLGTITKTDIAYWLTDFGIHFDDISSEKSPAVAYIDDKAIEFKGDWDDVWPKFKALDVIAREEMKIDCWKDINSVEDIFDKLGIKWEKAETGKEK